ncbi:MAG: XdhC/CoxI family protein, partial [Bacteroidota bacterium]
MKELLATLNSWIFHNKRFAVATVIKTWGSSPRPVGSTMLISEDMEMAGSVSGGCVEGAVVREAVALLKSGNSKILSYGVTDEDAWEVGLSCGGSIRVFVEPFLAFDTRPKEKEIWEELNLRLNTNKSAVLISKLGDGQPSHSLLLPEGKILGNSLSHSILQSAHTAFKERKHQLIETEEENFFVQVFAKRSQMLIIGAAHITVDLVGMAQNFGFETIVIDPRGAFSNKTQFPQAPDKIYEKYPAEVLPEYELDPYTYAVVLSHDPKIDDNAL